VKIFNQLMIIFIGFYKRAISPLLPNACRFHPTCSEYARESFQKFSFFKAFSLMTKRILRCQPFCKGGFDPVENLTNRTENQ